MVGLIFFLTSSPILDLGHFLQVILPIVLQIMAITPTIRCCSQHLMVGVNFFFDLFSHSGLRGIFHKWFCQLYYKLCPIPKITPTIRCCSQHLMVGVNFFLTSSPILDLGHFSQVILPIVLLIMPQLSGAVHSIWWLGFFLTCSQILDLGHFSQIILPIVLQTICPTIRCCSQHLMVGVNFFFDLFSHSGLRAFFTSDFANCTTNYAPAQK